MSHNQRRTQSSYVVQQSTSFNQKTYKGSIQATKPHQPQQKINHQPSNQKASTGMTVKNQRNQTHNTFVQKNTKIEQHFHVKPIVYKENVACQACDGTGEFNGTAHRRCNGLGFVNINPYEYRYCTQCNGNGVVSESYLVVFSNDVLCKCCQGLGLVKVKG